MCPFNMSPYNSTGALPQGKREAAFAAMAQPDLGLIAITVSERRDLPSFEFLVPLQSVNTGAGICHIGAAQGQLIFAFDADRDRLLTLEISDLARAIELRIAEGARVNLARLASATP